MNNIERTWRLGIKSDSLSKPKLRKEMKKREKKKKEKEKIRRTIRRKKAIVYQHLHLF